MYLESDTLLLANVFENFRKLCLEIYQLDPEKPLSVVGLAWQADIDMLLIVEQGIRDGIWPYMIFAMVYHFHLKEWKLKKLKSLLVIYIIKLNILFMWKT